MIKMIFEITLIGLTASLIAINLKPKRRAVKRTLPKGFFDIEDVFERRLKI